MARTAAERAKEYRDRKRDENVTVDCDARHENVTVPDCDAPSVAECQARALPALPDDDVIACNVDVDWPDVLAMTKSQVDYVYRAWRAVGDNVLLRLRRAAGYWRRLA